MEVGTTDRSPSRTNTSSPISFAGVKELWELLESTTGDSVQVNQVSVDDFLSISAEREARGRKYRLFYDRSTEVLVITVPTHAHEILHRWLDAEIGKKTDAMGLGGQLDPIGSATLENRSGGTLQTSLEGDSCRVPASRTGPDSWPVLVIEAGCSQTIEQLRIKAQAWFLASNFEVKIVLLVKMDLSEEMIVLEKWKVVQAGGRAGDTTRAGSGKGTGMRRYRDRASRTGVSNRRLQSPIAYLEGRLGWSSKTFSCAVLMTGRPTLLFPRRNSGSSHRGSGPEPISSFLFYPCMLLKEPSVASLVL
jgi:hypothetical protein